MTAGKTAPWPHGEIGSRNALRTHIRKDSRFESEWGYGLEFDFRFLIRYNDCMLKCNKCGKFQEESEFAWKNKSLGTRNKTCKSCHRDYSKKHYQENTEKYREKARRSNPRYYQESKKIILDYLASHPCADCGNSDIRVLQFDHIVPLRKRGGRISARMNPSRLFQEFEKCEVRCANCHMIRTFEQMGWERVMPV